MWVGGVRVIIPDETGRILMVKQHHEGRDIWMVPGGGIEEGENAEQAAIREVKEETGLTVRIKRMVWHMEEVSEQRGQRFVNFFLAEIVTGKAALGMDPEFDEMHQVMKELKFFTKQEIKNLPIVYPEFLRTELEEALEPKFFDNKVFKRKESF